MVKYTDISKEEWDRAEYVADLLDFNDPPLLGKSREQICKEWEVGAVVTGPRVEYYPVPAHPIAVFGETRKVLNYIQHLTSKWPAGE